MAALTVAFTLAAPLASFGDRISGSVRPTAEVPTWSALVGLLGAALGLRRGDAALAQLARDYAPALVADNVGSPLTDFHTIESASEVALRARQRADGAALTRAQELQATDTTSITHRGYRQDVRYRVFVAPVVDAPAVEPATLAQALNQPRFALYAGRRSCPLSEPPAARLEPLDREAVTHWDARLGELKPASHRRIRHDLLVSAQPRVFAAREEYVA